MLNLNTIKRIETLDSIHGTSHALAWYKGTYNVDIVGMTDYFFNKFIKYLLSK